jgi:hypothetical protein
MEVKDFPYFKFYTEEWLSGDISYCSDAAQLMFVRFCVHSMSNGGYLENNDLLKRRLNICSTDAERAFNELLETRCIKQSDEGLYAKFIVEQIDDFIDKNRQCVNAGKASAVKRIEAKKNRRSTGVQQKSNGRSTDAEQTLNHKDKDKDKNKKEDTIGSVSYRQHGKTVLLTDDEMKRLTADYGAEDTQAAIEYLDNYLVNNPKKLKEYKEHNRVIRNWVIVRVRENKASLKKSESFLNSAVKGDPIKQGFAIGQKHHEEGELKWNRPKA